ncbi:MAG: HPr family phosphocarrier protein [Candidatus Cloacimonetes bacterium]|jgi:phosphocarrier protein|nr:HPr family phosphocarrier protein [Candidatus Cloacimonadota bacterium]MDD4156290.1 HPr family phosphocarrier protein [Candidatus Cloacimonadota bacterium]
MIRKKITIQNKLGLHARPCSLLVKTVNKFRSDVKIQKDDMLVNGKSIMGVMMLAAEHNSEIELIIDGVDEEDTLDAVVDLFNSKFDEE